MKYYANFLRKGCFTWEYVCRLAGNENTASNIIQRYLVEGLIRRVRRNLYITINLTDGSPVANEYVIASNIAPGSYVSYHSAFSYYGFSNQFLFESVIVKEVVAFSLLKHYASHLLGLGRPC